MRRNAKNSMNEMQYKIYNVFIEYIANNTLHRCLHIKLNASYIILRI